MTAILLQALTGLSSASALFLVASGLTVIFGVTRIVNFAHGSLTMLGAYLAWVVLMQVPRDPVWFVAGGLLAAVLVGGIGVVLEILLLRRLYRMPELLQLLATFGVVLVIQDAALWIWGAEERTLPRPRWLRASVEILGERFPVYDLILIGVAPLVLGLLLLLLYRTRWGRLVRAATQDRDMLAALGANERWIFTSVFFLGATLAGLGGALMLPGQSANLSMDLALIVDAFVVVVVGGLGSITGAYLAAVLIGLMHAFGIMLLPKVTLVLIFLVMGAVLAVRPHGLLGRALVAPHAGGEDFPLLRAMSQPVLLLASAGVCVLLAAPLLLGPYLLSLLTEALILVLFAASLHFMMGPGGMPSFGHAAWFGIGAYTAAFLAPLSMSLAMPAAILAAGVAALLVGALVVRLSGVYMAMLTLAFAQIVWAAASQLVEITGGDNGILGVRAAGWAQEARVFYWLVLALCLGGALLLRRVLFAPFGYALRATRDSALRAEAIGIATYPVRAAGFAIAGAAAGLAGAVYAFQKGSVFPTYISIPKSVDALLMVLLGGVQTIGGPVIGALVYTGLYDTLLRSTDYWRLALGSAIIVLVLAFPRGLAGLARGRA